MCLHALLINISTHECEETKRLRAGLRTRGAASVLSTVWDLSNVWGGGGRSKEDIKIMHVFAGFLMFTRIIHQAVIEK